MTDLNHQENLSKEFQIWVFKGIPKSYGDFLNQSWIKFELIWKEISWNYFIHLTAIIKNKEHAMKYWMLLI